MQGLLECEAGVAATEAQQEAAQLALAMVDTILEDEHGPDVWESLFPGGVIPTLPPSGEWDCAVRSLAIRCCGQ